MADSRVRGISERSGRSADWRDGKPGSEAKMLAIECKHTGYTAIKILDNDTLNVYTAAVCGTYAGFTGRVIEEGSQL
jgi:hypothetical protein